MRAKKMKKENMLLNRETAMRLWNKTFGNKTKVKDFTGRVIVKGAYNDRNSEYGWNVDHIYPQSRGGKTADHNLICCHILTNDEKADKYPTFKANGLVFDIIRVENHYEIKQKHQTNNKENLEDELNLYDSASGIRFFKELKGIQNKPRFVGVVKIELKNLTNTAIVDFIEEIFQEESFLYDTYQFYINKDLTIYITNYNIPLKSDTQKLLDKCILINTYLKDYFEPLGYVDSYNIFFREDYYEDKKDLYCIGDVETLFRSIGSISIFDYTKNQLYLNQLVYINTEASQKERYNYVSNDEFKQYDYIYTHLAENLRKEISK